MVNYRLVNGRLVPQTTSTNNTSSNTTTKTNTSSNTISNQTKEPVRDPRTGNYYGGIDSKGSIIESPSSSIINESCPSVIPDSSVLPPVKRRTSFSNGSKKRTTSDIGSYVVPSSITSPSSPIYSSTNRLVDRLSNSSRGSNKTYNYNYNYPKAVLSKPSYVVPRINLSSSRMPKVETRINKAFDVYSRVGVEAS